MAKERTGCLTQAIGSLTLLLITLGVIGIPISRQTAAGETQNLDSKAEGATAAAGKDSSKDSSKGSSKDSGKDSGKDSSKEVPSANAATPLKDLGRTTTSTPANSVTTHDVDFGPYMADTQRRIKRNWYPPKSFKTRKLMVMFKIYRDGTVTNVRLEKPSGFILADLAGIDAVQNSAPMRPLPEGAPASVDIQFTFDYNVFSKDPGQLEESLRKTREKTGDNRKEISSLLLAIGDSYANKGEMEKAKDNFAKGIASTEALNGKGSKEVVDAMAWEAHSLYASKNDYLHAEKILSDAEGAASAAKNQIALAAIDCKKAEILEEPQLHWPQAEQLLRTAHNRLKLVVDNAADNTILLMIAECCTKQNKDGQAVDVLRDALKSQSEAAKLPSDKKGLLRIAKQLAELYRSKNHDNEKAMKTMDEIYSIYLSKLGESSPLTLEALQDCGNMATEINETEKAKKYFATYNSLFYKARLTVWEKVVANNPSVDNLLGYGICLEDAGNKSEAGKQYQRALDLSPGDKRIQEHISGLSKPMQNQQSSATSVASTTVLPDSNSAKINNDGVKLMMASDFKGAVSKFRTALQLTPEYRIARENFAIAENNWGISLQGTPSEAVKHFRLALYMDSNGTANQNLDLTLKKLKVSFPVDHVKLAEECLSQNDYVGAVVEYRFANRVKNEPQIQDKINSLIGKAFQQAMLDDPK